MVCMRICNRLYDGTTRPITLIRLVLGVMFVAQYLLSNRVAGREQKLVPVLPPDAPEVVTRGQVFAQRRDGDGFEAVVLPAVGLVERDLVPA